MNLAPGLKQSEAIQKMLSSIWNPVFKLQCWWFYLAKKTALELMRRLLRPQLLNGPMEFLMAVARYCATKTLRQLLGIRTRIGWEQLPIRLLGWNQLKPFNRCCHQFGTRFFKLQCWMVLHDFTLVRKWLWSLGQSNRAPAASSWFRRKRPE